MGGKLKSIMYLISRNLEGGIGIAIGIWKKMETQENFFKIWMLKEMKWKVTMVYFWIISQQFDDEHNDDDDDDDWFK